MPVTFTTYPDISTLNFSNGTITTLWGYGSTLTNGIISPLFLAMCFIICYAALAPSNRSEHAYTSAAFITMMVAFGLTAAGVLSPLYLLMAIANAALGLYLSSRLNEVS